MKIRRPTTLGEAQTFGADGEFLAGGTDLLARRESSGIDVAIDLFAVSERPEMMKIEVTPTGAFIGALTSLQSIASHPKLNRKYRALTLPAGILATPQIRRVATLGGVLCQRTRCSWYRSPDFTCAKKGGTGCPAREAMEAGRKAHLLAVTFMTGSCIHPHPSSIALGMLAYDATFDTDRRSGVPVAELYGDGGDPSTDHQLVPGEILTSVQLPNADASDRCSYVRLMGRREAEWPRVECVVRLVIEGGVIRDARIALGAVATIPMRAPAAEALLVGVPVGGDPTLLSKSATAATQLGEVLPASAHKLPMIHGVVLTALERALGLEVSRRESG